MTSKKKTGKNLKVRENQSSVIPSKAKKKKKKNMSNISKKEIGTAIEVKGKKYRDTSLRKMNKNKTRSKRKNLSTKSTHKYKQSHMKTISLVLWDFIFYIFLGAIIVSAVFFSFNDKPDKSFFGYRFMTVLTNSMSPNPEKPELKNGFTSGAVIIIKQVNPKEIKKGDIITFYPVKGNTQAYLTHRVVKTMNELDGEKGTFIQTQGDANSGEDIPIESSQVVGKVILSIPGIGNILNFIRSNIVIVTTFIALLFGFLIMLKYYLSMYSGNKLKKKSKNKGKR